MLRRTLNARIGQTGLPITYVAKLWSASLVGGAVAWSLRIGLPPFHPAITAVFVLVPYGLVFFAMTLLLRIPEASRAVRGVTRGGR